MGVLSGWSFTSILVFFFFFFNDTATTEIYTLSLHDALPISTRQATRGSPKSLGGSTSGVRLVGRPPRSQVVEVPSEREDRKSTRLNSSHANISYAVFCLKKKNITYKS